MTEESDDGLNVDEILTMMRGLPPFARKKLADELVRADPKGHTLGQLLPSTDEVLGPELVELFKNLTEHRLPGRQGVVAAEMIKLHDQRIARELYDELAAPSAEVQSRLVEGGQFVLDIPPDVPAVWGRGSSVVWAEGESFLLSGPPGVGKTTLAGQIVRGRLVGGELLGMPIRPTEARVLYLAMDRPQQIARALHRMLGDVKRDVLDERLVAWDGPPLRDLAKHPDALLELAQQVGADTVVLDSLKDAAIGLTEDEVGSGYNRARQLCLAYGVEVMELHHTVKKGDNGSAPNKLEHVYGSAWITAGAGSVVSLHGQPGDPIVQWRHLKQPAEEVGPFKLSHDHELGVSSIWDAADVLALARQAGDEGVTARGVAVVMFDKAKPSDNDVQKARRKLDGFVKKGELIRTDGDAGSKTPSVWVAVSDFELDDVL